MKSLPIDCEAEKSGEMEPTNNNLPSTRKEAVSIGSAHYYTGKPCKHGHLSKRRTNDRMCLECCSIRRREYYKENRDTVLENIRIQRLSNKEEINRKRRERYADNIDGERKKLRVRRLLKPNQFLTYDRRHRGKPGVRLHRAVSEGVRRSLNGNKVGRSTFDLLRYTPAELHEHIERLFSPGMTWENYGEWEIDHKNPMSAHNFTTHEDIDFKRCWDLSNLQPLWRRENRSKGDKLPSPFQPSLALAVPANDKINNKEAA